MQTGASQLQNTGRHDGGGTPDHGAVTPGFNRGFMSAQGMVNITPRHPRSLSEKLFEVTATPAKVSIVFVPCSRPMFPFRFLPTAMVLLQTVGRFAESNSQFASVSRHVARHSSEAPGSARGGCAGLGVLHARCRMIASNESGGAFISIR